MRPHQTLGFHPRHFQKVAKRLEAMPVADGRQVEQCLSHKGRGFVRAAVLATRL